MSWQREARNHVLAIERWGAVRDPPRSTGQSPAHIEPHHL